MSLRTLFTFVFFTLFFITYSQRPVDLIRKQLLQPDSKEILVAAHRADWRNAPENSIAAIKSAIAMGVDMVEVDIKKTKDGQLVIMHDTTLDRTTTGKGRVADFTLDSLKKLFLRNGCKVPTRHRIPTLEEVMLTVKGKVMVNLDHCYPYMKEAYTVLQKTGTLDQALFKGEPKTADSIRKDYGVLIDRITYMPIIEINDSTASGLIRDFQKEIHPVAFELIFDKDNFTLLRNLEPIREQGSRVWVNSLWPSLCGGHDDDLAYDEGKTEESWGWLIAHGVNMIQTDRPQALLAYLKKRKLHK